MNFSDSKATVLEENKKQERNAQEQAVLLKRCSCQVTLWLNKQSSGITAAILTCLNLLRCMMRTSGKVQRLSVMLPCCSCLQCGHRHASSGASYKEEAQAGISFKFQGSSHCFFIDQGSAQAPTHKSQLPSSIHQASGF